MPARDRGVSGTHSDYIKKLTFALILLQSILKPVELCLTKSGPHVP